MQHITEIIICIITVASFIYGIHNFFKKGVAMYAQLITCAIGCFALSRIFRVVTIATTGTIPIGFHVGYFGSFGCFLFLLSANYGIMNNLLDDGSKAYTKYRLLSLIAPAVFSIGCIVLMLSDLDIGGKVVLLIMQIPIIISSYYCMKILLLPDNDFGFAKAIKPTNACSLAFTLLNTIYIFVSARGNDVAMMIVGVLIAVSCFATILATKRGVKQWVI